MARTRNISPGAARAGLTFAWADDAIAIESVPAARVDTGAILRRAYAIGASDYRIDALHGTPALRRRHVGSGIAALASAVPLAPALLLGRYRLRLLRRYARAAGKLASASGIAARPYAALSS